MHREEVRRANGQAEYLIAPTQAGLVAAIHERRDSLKYALILGYGAHILCALYVFATATIAAHGIGTIFGATISGVTIVAGIMLTASTDLSPLYAFKKHHELRRLWNSPLNSISDTSPKV